MIPDPEAQIYGGISMGIAATAFLAILASSNNSFTWTRVCCFLSPFVLLISVIRAGSVQTSSECLIRRWAKWSSNIRLMTFRLNAYQSNVAWECANGRQVWNETMYVSYYSLLQILRFKKEQCQYGDGTYGINSCYAYSIFWLWVSRTLSSIRFLSCCRLYSPSKWPRTQI